MEALWCGVCEEPIELVADLEFFGEENVPCHTYCHPKEPIDKLIDELDDDPDLREDYLGKTRH